MKLLAIVGANADFSYNRFLEQFMARRYQDQVEIEVYGIADLPRFKKEVQPDSKVEESKNRIHETDSMIFAIPEYGHEISSSLKGAMERTSSHAQGNADVMKAKPAVVLGMSYGIQGASKAQEEMREILLLPDQGASVLPGNEILIGYTAGEPDRNTGDLLDQETIYVIDLAFNNSVKFVGQAKK